MISVSSSMWVVWNTAGTENFNQFHQTQEKNSESISAHYKHSAFSIKRS
jgi:hypothetical protein